jgi:hypothetical protein
LLSPDQQFTGKLQESEGKYLNYLYTSAGGAMLTSLFCKILFANSKLWPLGMFYLEGGNGGTPKQVEQAKYCGVELTKQQTNKQTTKKQLPPQTTH